jgi:putative N6-adenine-specific DNA methylase
LKSIGLKPTKKTKVFNGDLECSFRKFEIYDGSKKAGNEEKLSEE